MKKRLLLTLLLLLPLCCQAIELRSQLLTTNNGLANNTILRFYQDSKGFIWICTTNGLSRYNGNSFFTLRPDPSQPISLADHRIWRVDEDQNGFLWVLSSSEQFSCYDLKREQFVDYTGTGEYKQFYSHSLFAQNAEVWLWHFEGKSDLRRVSYRNGAFASETFSSATDKLPDNRINFVTEDAQHRIWVGTRKGLARITEAGVTEVDAGHDYRYILEGEGSDIYFVTQDNRVMRHGEQGELEPVVRLHTLASEPTGALFHQGEVILFTSAGVFTYDTSNQKVHAGNRLFSAPITSGSVIRDNKGNPWIYNHTGNMWYLNRQEDRVRAFTLIPREKVDYVDFERYAIFHDSRDMIWISTYGNGLFAYLPEEDELIHYSSDVDGHAPIGTDFLQTVIEDRSGAIWVGTDYAGISQITVLSETIKRIYPEDRQLMDRSNTIRMIHRASDGTVRIANRNGRLYTYDEQVERILKQEAFPSSIYSMEEDSKGRTWYGTRGSGILLDGQWYRHEPGNPHSLSNNHVFHLYEDTRGNLWVATFGGGLNLAQEENGGITFRHFLNGSNRPQREIRIMCEDANGKIWVGTNDGVYIFTPESLIAGQLDYHHYTYQKGAFNSNDIRALYCDRKGNVWIGTAGGLSVCNPKDDYDKLVFQTYSTREGLVNNSVQSIIEDNFGNIWLATQYGISRYWAISNTFENYHFSIHNLGNVYSENSIAIGSNGELFFGTNHGLTVLDPGTVRKSSFPSPAVFVGMRINGVETNAGEADSPLSQSLAYSDKITLNHTQNTFVVDFSTFNFAAVSPTKYTYRLDNYDKNWSEVTPVNFASYKNLPPGNYQLRVKSSNSSGEWNSEETVLDIRITPPFWRTHFALILFAGLLAALLYISFRVMRNFTRLRHKMQLEEELMEYKLVFFTNISHEFRTPLTLIQAGLEKIKRKAMLSKETLQPLETLDKSTKRMLRLINQLIEFRKMQHHKLSLSLEETDVIGFLREIFQSFADMAESKAIDYSFQPFEERYQMYIDQGMVDKIAYNLLSNAFKYTPIGGAITLVIKANTTTRKLIIEVTDTGVGISIEHRTQMFKRYAQSRLAPESTGIGLHLTHELTLVHKGSIDYRENQNGGSRFIVCLPLDMEVYEKADFLPLHATLLRPNARVILPEAYHDLADFPKKFPATPYHLLIIEDDYDVRSFLKEELSAYFTTDTAPDGESGLKKTTEKEYDMILCDVMMPGISGLEVTRRLKSDFNTSHIPVVLLTALGMEEHQIDGIESGADAYITKPFGLKVLLTTLYQLIDQREKLRQKYTSESGILPSPLPASEQDRQFIEKLNRILEENIGNADFSVDDFARAMKLGRTVFYKKMKGLTGYSPNEYTRIIRMKKAAELLQQGGFTVAEVTYKVGINNPFYFSKCFKEQFGVAPSFYQKGKEPPPGSRNAGNN